MRTFSAVVHLLIGAPLVIGGIWGIVTGVIWSHGEQLFEILIIIGIAAALVGSYLCYLAWLVYRELEK